MARVAASQHGVFARRQAEALGATRGIVERRLRTGRWERRSPGVFRIAGNPGSWLQDLMVACLAWGADAVISHRAAAALWRLVGFEPGTVELTVPRTRRRQGPGVVHRHPTLSADVTTIHGIPVTTPVRTLVDLAAVVPVERVEEALDDAMRRQIVTPGSLRRCLAAVGRPVPDSVFERRVLRLLKRASLPVPELQHEIRSGAHRVAVVDFAYPEARLAIEADGYQWHSGRTRWDRDRARRNRLTTLGWRVIHVTWTDLKNPGDLIAAIRKALVDDRP